MLPSIESIRQLRVKVGMTQRKLSTLAGVSTSMINQIESGRCKPSYDTARRIFEILSSLEGQSSLKAGDICNRKVIAVQKNESLHDAINKMRSNSISQIPVFDGSRVTGILSEDGLAKAIMETNIKNLHDLLISMVMDPPPPIVDVATPAKALIPLVRFSKCVLVSEKGNVIGVMTVTDTLKMVE